MNAEQWNRVDRIFHKVLEREPDERARFLEKACADEVSLRTEVEALLAAHAKAGGFLESAAATVLFPLKASIASGTRLGTYEILSAIGAGGMGEVYKAHDARLQRNVAVKVLQRGAIDAPAWERFQHETRSVSALNHPNICMVHDVGEADGQPYLVMELLEGVTLSNLNDREPLETGAALGIASQIAAALETAHAKGIIHRNIKPTNVMITGRGHVKVLDFCLPTQSAIRGQMDAPRLNSVTMAATVAGTSPYLSPEVLRGARADARSDLWAFGVLLYQMLTGRLPFTGTTVLKINSAIMNDPMPPLPAVVPVGLRAIVQRCLTKRAADRYQGAGEVRSALKALQTRPAAANGMSRRTWLQAAGAAAVASSGTLWWLWQTEFFWTNPLPLAPFERLTDFTGDEYSAAISPDGKFAAYIRDHDGQLDAWVRQIGTGVKPINVTNSKYRPPKESRNWRGVGFGGTGEHVWFLNNPTSRPYEVYLAYTRGGAPRQLQVDGSPAWSPANDRLVYDDIGGSDSIFIADGDGNNRKKIFAGELGVHCHFPIWSRDGLFIYFVKGVVVTGDMDIWRIGADGAALERITSHNAPITHPDWFDSRTLIYTVMAADSSEQHLYLIDVERRHPHPVKFDEQYLSVAISNSRPRRLVATRARPTATLHTLSISDSLQSWQDVRSFDVLNSVNPRVLSPRFAAALAPDSPGYLLFLSSKWGRDGLWKLENGTPAELWNASEGGIVAPPAISSDGQWICFSFRKLGRSGLYVMSSAGGPWHNLADSLDIRGAAAWSPDGKSVTVAANRNGEGTRLFNVPFDSSRGLSGGGVPERLVDTISYDPLWSTDGGFILYAEPGAQDSTTILKAVTVNRAPVLLSTVRPLYGNPGIVYRFIPGRKTIIALVFDKDTQRQCFDSVDLQNGETRRLAELEVGRRIRDFDISPDGKQIIFDHVQDNSHIVWTSLP